MTNVWYVGPSETRVLTVDDWAGLGVTVEEATVWDINNGWSISESAFSSKQLEILAGIYGFTIGNPDGPRVHSPLYRPLPDAVYSLYLEQMEKLYTEFLVKLANSGLGGETENPSPASEFLTIINTGEFWNTVTPEQNGAVIVMSNVDGGQVSFVNPVGIEPGWHAKYISATENQVGFVYPWNNPNAKLFCTGDISYMNEKGQTATLIYLGNDEWSLEVSRNIHVQVS